MFVVAHDDLWFDVRGSLFFIFCSLFSCSLLLLVLLLVVVMVVVGHSSLFFFLLRANLNNGRVDVIVHH